MPLEKFTLATIAEMDGGRIRTAFEQALTRLEADCKDRPGVKAARKLELILSMEPIADGQDLDSVDITFRIKDSVPKRESKSYNMAAVPGGLLFNDASPEDVKQKTLDMAPKPNSQVETGSRKAKRGLSDAEVADVG